MPFLRPAIHVYQQLISTTSPAITPFFELCLIGPSYQVQNSIAFPAYATGTEYSSHYVGQTPGTTVELSSVNVAFQDIKVKVWPQTPATMSETVVIANASAVTTMSATDSFNTAGVLPGDTVIVKVDTFTYTSTVQSLDSTGLIITLGRNIPTPVGATSIKATIIRPVTGETTVITGTNNSQHVTIPASVTKTVNSVSLLIYSASVYVSYRALRTYLGNEFQQVTNTSDYVAVFGVADHQNPLALACSLALANTSISFKCLPIATDDNDGYLAALDVLTNDNTVYVLVPLTQDPSIISAYAAHCTTMSMPEKSKWRVMYANLEQPDTKIMSELQTGTVSVGNEDTFFVRNVADGNFRSNACQYGDYVDMYDSSNEWVTSLKIENVLNETALEVGKQKYTKTDVGYTPVITGGAYYTVPELHSATRSRDSSNVARLVCSSAHNLNSGDTVTITDMAGTGYNVVNAAATIVDETTFTYPSTGTQETATTDTAGHIVITNRVEEFPLEFQVVRVLTTQGIADAMVSIARSYMNKRVRLVQPDQVLITIGSTDYLLPGYYLCAAYGSMRAGLPPHQGFTTLGVSGIKQILRSNKVFKDTQLDEMAGGGIFWVVQDTVESLPYCIYQTTTDTTQLETIEDSIVATVDYASMFYRDNLRAVLGRFNVNNISMKYVSKVIADVTEKMLNMTYPYIGSIITAGSLKSITSSADTITPVVTISVPYPVNAVDLYLEV